MPATSVRHPFPKRSKVTFFSTFARDLDTSPGNSRRNSILNASRVHKLGSWEPHGRAVVATESDTEVVGLSNQLPVSLY